MVIFSLDVGDSMIRVTETHVLLRPISHLADEFSDHSIPRSVLEHLAVRVVYDRSHRVLETDDRGNFLRQVDAVAFVCVRFAVYAGSYIGVIRSSLCAHYG